eukprot:TRINITY_DN4237_c0_g1_i1.p1 TRINITY_DN4237_c0_g1~~TRINITY_DN4237_c0_g1_i1.p1  ORF type:complete len:246 (+),score=4.82 TRINITY_DN4237_c0_g1_i1:61-798(+)
MERVALVLGATGATGKTLVRQLCQRDAWSEIRVAVRSQLSPEDAIKNWGSVAPAVEEKARKEEQEHPLYKLRQYRIDYDNLQDTLFEGADTVFCCLGTTKAKAGSAEAFRRVDYDYVLASAQKALQAGCRHFLLLSSAGSSSSSWLLYPRTKGEIEEACGKLGFPRYSIFRPSLLLTEREDNRPTERVFQYIMPKLDFMIPESMSAVSVDRVAEAMIVNAESAAGPTSAYELYENSAILHLRVSP